MKNVGIALIGVGVLIGLIILVEVVAFDNDLLEAVKYPRLSIFLVLMPILIGYSLFKSAGKKGREVISNNPGDGAE